MHGRFPSKSSNREVSINFLSPAEDLDIDHRKAPLDQRRPRGGTQSAPLLTLIGKDPPLRNNLSTPASRGDNRQKRRRRRPAAQTDLNWKEVPGGASMSTSGFLAKAAERIGSLADQELEPESFRSYGTGSFSIHPASWPLASMKDHGGGSSSSNASPGFSRLQGVRPASKQGGSAGDRPDSAGSKVTDLDDRAVRNISFSLNIPVDVVWQACELFVKYADHRRDDKAPASNYYGGMHLRLPSLIKESDRLTRNGFAKVLRELMACDPQEELPAGVVAEAFQYADRDGGGELDYHGFAEYMNTDPHQRALRKLAEKHGMDVAVVERCKRRFDEVDSDKTGLIQSKDFKILLQKCSQAPATAEMPAFRVERFWRLADKSHHGEIDLDNFLIFYRNHFDLGGAGGDGYESYYRGFRRVGCSN